MQVFEVARVCDGRYENEVEGEVTGDEFIEFHARGGLLWSQADVEVLLKPRVSVLERVHGFGGGFVVVMLSGRHGCDDAPARKSSIQEQDGEGADEGSFMERARSFKPGQKDMSTTDFNSI